MTGRPLEKPGELQMQEASLRNEVLQLTLKQVGSVIPVEEPESLEVMQLAREAVESIPRLSSEQELEQVQDRIDAMRVSYSQLTSATRKATRNLEQQLKKTVNAMQKQQKRDAKDFERQQQREDKRRKLISELGKQAGQDNKPNLLSLFSELRVNDEIGALVVDDVKFKEKREELVGKRPWVIQDSQAAGGLIQVSSDASALSKMLARFGSDFVNAGSAQTDACVKAPVLLRVRQQALDFMAQFTNHKAQRSDASSSLHLQSAVVPTRPHRATPHDCALMYF